MEKKIQILTLLEVVEIPGKFQEYLKLYHLCFQATAGTVHTFAHQNLVQSQSIATVVVSPCSPRKVQRYQEVYLDKKENHNNYNKSTQTINFIMDMLHLK